MFFADAKAWLPTPFKAYSPQPTMKSVRAHLPAVAGNPPWNEEGMTAVLRKVIHPQSGFRAPPPHGTRSEKTLRSPKSKAPGPNGVAPHVLQGLPATL